MSFLAALAPYLVPVATAVYNDRVSKHFADRQKLIASQMGEYQTGKAKEGQASIEDFIKAIAPERRAADASDVTDELGAGLRQSVGAAQAFEKPDNFAGKVTDNYTNRVASNAAAVKDRLAKAMQQLAVIGSPAERNLRTQFRFGDTASAVDAANSAIGSSGRAFQGSIANQRPGIRL